jgi:hypothetical protein
VLASTTVSAVKCRVPGSRISSRRVAGVVARTVTDAAAVAVLVRQAADSGTRVYIRPASRAEVPAPKPEKA